MKTLIKILLILMPVICYGQTDTTKFYLSADTSIHLTLSEFTEFTIFNDTSIGNELIVWEDSTFEVRGDTMEVIKMLWRELQKSDIEYNSLFDDYVELLDESKKFIADIKKSLKTLPK